MYEATGTPDMKGKSHKGEGGPDQHERPEEYGFHGNVQIRTRKPYC